MYPVKCNVLVISFDLDGTLVSRDYVDYFWLELVPRLYAIKHNVSEDEAKRIVFSSYDEIGPGDVRWYNPRYWFKRFEIEEYLHAALREASELIKPYRDALEVIEILRGKYELVISTSAARDFVNLVIERIPQYRESFKLIFSSSSDFGLPGKPPAFFKKIAEILKVKPQEIVHIGDDEENDFRNAIAAGLNAFHVNRQQNKDLRAILNNISSIDD